MLPFRLQKLLDLRITYVMEDILGPRHQAVVWSMVVFHHVSGHYIVEVTR